MKKAVFSQMLLLLLLPLFSLAQTIDLVKWDGLPHTQGLNPTLISPNVSAQPITGTGISLSAGYDGFNSTGWDTSNTFNTNKYMEYVVGGVVNNVVTIKEINFVYKGTQNSYRARWSTDNFVTSTEIAAVDNAVRNNNNTSGNIQNLNIAIPAGKKLQVRFYAFNGAGEWRMFPGVTFRGTAPAPTPLNGTLTIGTGSSNTFTTITQAVNALNTIGVNGAVTLLLNDDLYTNAGESFPITINQVTGASLTNTITFKPAPGKNVLIRANNIPNINGVPSVFKLHGADYIIFDGSNTAGGTTRNLTINNANDRDYVQRSVIWINSNESNGATYNTIKNTNLRQGVKNQQGNFCVGIYSGGNGLDSNNGMNISAASANNSNLTVVNNDFMNVKQGVYVNGGSPVTTNVVIHQNDLGSENNEETIIQPAYLNNVNTFDFTENLIYNLYRNTTSGSLVSSGIYIAGNSQNGNILKNNMSDLIKTTGEQHTLAGIVLASTITNANILVANNFILNVAAKNIGEPFENGHGIVIIAGGGYKIYHNTVVLNTAQLNNDTATSMGFSSALYIQGNLSNLDIRNNIFVNNQTNVNTRRCAILVKGTPASAFTFLDYNDYYSVDKYGSIGSNPNDPNDPGYQSSFSGWKSRLSSIGTNANSRDTRSIDVNPTFVSTTDLHLSSSNNSALDNKGTFLTVVPKDIDGQLRNTTTPDMGADEFGAISMPVPGSNAGIYCTSSTTYDGINWSNGTPTAEKDVIFTGNYTQTGSTLNACSIFVQGTARVNFISNANAVVTHNVNVATGAALTFESGSNLIQSTNTQNIGNVTVKRNSSMLKRLDYTLWSSPVAGTQTMTQFSPETTSNRFYIYNTNTNLYNAIANPATETFAKAKGYLIRMPNGDATPGYNAGTTAIVHAGIFNGIPNNGTITIPLVYTSAAQSYNAVGNPYPSPINITDFIDANIDNIEGSIYVWRKTNDPTKSSYWTVNKTGYTLNSAPGGTNDLVASPFAIDPTGLLNTAQGFLVKAKSNKPLVFRNNMRRANNMNTFFRTGQPDATTTQTETTGRLWLNVVNNENVFTQTLLAYTNGATKGYDNGLDGESLGDGTINIYSVAANMNLAIQARPEFDVYDTVPLGFKTSLAGRFEFTVDHMDGFFAGDQKVLIKDKVTGAIHNIKGGNYSFASEAGTFNDRFEIIYTTDKPLGTDNPEITANEVVVYGNNKQVNVQSTQSIQSVMIYDTLGRTVYEKGNIDALSFSSSDLNTAQQVLIVRVTLNNQQVISKKIMLK